MSQETKRTSLLFLLGALTALVVLSGSLSHLELHAGTPFPDLGIPSIGQPGAPEPMQAYPSMPFPGFLSLILLLLIVYALMRSVTSVNLKQLLGWIFKFILILTTLSLVLIFLLYLNSGSITASEEIIPPTPSAAMPTSPLEQPPQGLIWFVIIGFVLAGTFFIVRIFRQQVPSAVEDPLLQQAKDAVQALRAGRDFKNVIINCYLQMANTLREEHGIERNGDTTAREFQHWLELKGWPRVPVQQLTSLFEKVRYGQQHLGENDEKLALDSLSEIVQFAESTKDESSAA